MNQRALSTSFFMVILVAAGILPAKANQTIEFELFTMSTPEGFSERPDMAMGEPDLLAIFVENEPYTKETDFLLVISRLKKMIPPGSFVPSDLPFEATIFDFPWLGYTLQGVVRRNISVGKTDGVQITIQFPVSPAAIQFGFQGPANREEELIQTAINVSKSVRGESNWVSRDEEYRTLGGIMGFVTLSFVGALLGAALLFSIIRKSAREPNG